MKPKKQKPSSRNPDPVADTPLREYSSMTACAGSTGIPIEIIKEAKSKGAPAFLHGRVQLLPLLRWIFGRESDDSSGTDWSQELAKVKTMRERIRLAEDEERVIPVAEVVEGLGAVMAALFGRLDRISSDLPPALKGLDELAIQRRILDETEHLRADLKTIFGGMAKADPK